MSPTIDLDAFLDEQNKDPLEFVFGGKVYKMPAEVPLLAMEEARKLDGEDVGIEEMGVVVDMFFGEGSWSQMRDDGMGFKAANKMLNAMLEDAMKGVDTEEIETENGENGDGGPKSKSPSKTAGKTSRSSKRASKGNTDSAPKT